MNIIYEAVHGSHAYGTNTPTSDIDIRGIGVMSKKDYLGFLEFDAVNQKHTEEKDETYFELKKFFALAAKCNPNVLEILFVDDSDIKKIDKLGLTLRENRHLFLSKRARDTFIGYAIAQLKRIESHRKWLLQPPTHKPTREEFGLPSDHKLITPSEMGAVEALLNNNESVPEHTMTLYSKERVYKSALDSWNKYDNWKKTRNPARAEIEAKYGYDCKHAGHLVRLLRMGREIAEQHTLIVKRPDAEELLAIRNGKYTYEELMEQAQILQKETEEAFKKSTLQATADTDALNNLCVSIIEESFK